MHASQHVTRIISCLVTARGIPRITIISSAVAIKMIKRECKSPVYGTEE
jgi:hypothetical protein